MEVSGQLHALALYPQGKIRWYPLDRRLKFSLSLNKVRRREEVEVPYA
jgi:hypothetical protein